MRCTGLVSWLQAEGAGECQRALTRLEEITNHSMQSDAEEEGDECDGREEEGDYQVDDGESDDDDGANGIKGGSEAPGQVVRPLAVMSISEVEAMPRKMIMEGGRYVDVDEQLRRDKEQWRRERKALKEDRRRLSCLTEVPPFAIDFPLAAEIICASTVANGIPLITLWDS
eukprot:scaffold101358_cov28-Prasinocladus_malaysianus.AAC.1